MTRKIYKTMNIIFCIKKHIRLEKDVLKLLITKKAAYLIFFIDIGQSINLTHFFYKSLNYLLKILAHYHLIL